MQKALLFALLFALPAVLCTRSTLERQSNQVRVVIEPGSGRLIDEADLGTTQLKDSTCGVCKFVLDEAKKYLNDTKTQAIILQDALQVCSTLPSDLASGCTDLVNTYEPTVTQFIVSADSSAVCLLLGACMFASPAGSKELEQAAHSTGCRKGMMLGGKQSPTSRFVMAMKAKMNEVAATNAKVAATAAVEASSSATMATVEGSLTDSCDVCKMAVIEAHSLIANPVVQSGVVNYTKAICQVAGGGFADACDEMVDTYIPIIFDLLENLLTPDDLCTSLGVCKALPALSSSSASTMFTMIKEELSNLAAKFSTKGTLPFR